MRVLDTIKDIYREVFPLVRPGGSFLNLDRVVPSIGKQIQWLRSAGFEDADCYWKGTRRALFGGFRPWGIGKISTGYPSECGCRDVSSIAF